MSEPIRWGVLGAAKFAREHMAPAIHMAAGAELAALATSNPEKAAPFRALQPRLTVHTSYDALLADTSIDAVYIPLPNTLHVEWTLKALRAGKHVLCEKPLTLDAEEADAVAAYCRERGVLLMEAFMYRFHPAWAEVWRLLDEGAIGRLTDVETWFVFRSRQDASDYRMSMARGGGALLDVGCYGVSAARLFLSGEPVAVQAQAIYTAGNGVDIHLVGNLRFANDTLATIEASFCSGLQQTYSIVGSAGVIDLPQDAFIPWEKDAVIYYRGAGAETGDEIVVPGVDEYRLMVEHFGDQVLKGVDSLVPVGESMRNLSVLDALARAAQTGCSVTPERKIAVAP